jgi:hypothetical protein
MFCLIFVLSPQFVLVAYLCLIMKSFFISRRSSPTCKASTYRTTASTAHPSTWLAFFPVTQLGVVGDGAAQRFAFARHLYIIRYFILDLLQTGKSLKRYPSPRLPTVTSLNPILHALTPQGAVPLGWRPFRPPHSYLAAPFAVELTVSQPPPRVQCRV